MLTCLCSKNGVSYYNPQVADGWSECFIPREVAMKEACRLLVFVITDDTRAVTSMLEVLPRSLLLDTTPRSLLLDAISFRWSVSTPSQTAFKYTCSAHRYRHWVDWGHHTLSTGYSRD